MRFFALPVAAFFCLAAAAFAQEQDSVFANYDSYGAFVDRHVMSRQFVPLIERLGGRDEYTPEQLRKNQEQLSRVWPRDFENVSVFRREDLGGGVSQEGRLYWTGTGYAFFYAMLHQRTDGLVVISFHLNTSSKAVMERF